MSVRWRAKNKDVLLQWIAALDAPAVHESLTPWEQHFLARLSFQVSAVGSVSQKQQEILERLYTDKTK